MSQHDYNIANQTFSATRTDLNNALGAVATNNAGNSAPSTTYANQWWFDSDGNTLYMRNKDNDAWVSILTIGATSDLQTITTDLISEVTSAAGVTIDGLLIKDGAVGAAGTASTVAGIPFYTASSSIYTHDVSGTDNSAENNAAYGLLALDAITNGDKNTAIGWSAGSAVTTGSENVYVGFLAGGTGVGTSGYNVMIGNEAGEAGTSVSESTFVGWQAATANTTGSHNIAIGYTAYDDADTENHNLAIGTHSLGGSVAGGEYNVAVGNYTLDALTSGDGNVAMGYQAGTDLTTAERTVFIGDRAGQNVTTGGGSVLIGGNAGNALTTGNNTIAIGDQALVTATTASNNMAIGIQAGYSIAGGEYNVAIGNYTLDALTSGDSNVAVGYNAGTGITTSSLNTIMGDAAAGYLTTGDGRNTVIGKDCFTAGTALTTGSNNIALGERCKVSTAAATFQFVIGSNVTGNGNSTTTIGYDTTEIATTHGSASWAAVSDERYKKDITDSTAGLTFIDDLRPVTFKFKQKNELATDIYGYDADSTDTDGYTDEVAHGFIAQEIKAVLDNHPEIKAGQEIWKQGTDEKSNRQSVSHIGMIPMLVKAIQELSAKVKALEEA